ncbi:hypothetical protein CDD83_4493 [Cordyceps sp. RAO-2017]|nr:hypothetical protein CDD83_4493 [Cordyceps sp. RAO-2017]
MAPSAQLPLTAFPTWARYNGLALTGVELQQIDGRGSGLVASGDPGGPGEGNAAALLRVPSDLVLSAEAVRLYAKVDANFRQLLEAVGQQPVRMNAMLYLLCHLVNSRRGGAAPRGGIVQTPWTDYVGHLPRYVPVPTMWSQAERLLLRGTSLEAALEAKLAALAREFEALRGQSEAMPFWNDFLWGRDAASVDDWILVDAWYRSRCLELPQVGDAMVPGLDMANHSSRPTAYYEVDEGGDVVLLPRPDCAAPAGREVTISYGEAKPAAEMLFSYGFVDPDSAARSLTLGLEPLADDPLAKAKAAVFDGPPVVRISRPGARVEWDSPFAYLMCLNREDGLEFGLLQDTAGGRELRLLWQGDDVTERAGQLGSLIEGHRLCPVFRLRAVAVLHERVERQLARCASDGLAGGDQLRPLVATGLLREACISDARALREAEVVLLEAAAQELDKEVRM